MDLPTRKIIHCDCDCFYAAVEIRDDPSLAQLPVAVGGAVDRRGVITTCNYLAREYGVDFDNNYIPHMTILQENGEVAGHQNPRDLSVDGDNGRRVYSKKRIAAFLSKHKPARTK